MRIHVKKKFYIGIGRLSYSPYVRGVEFGFGWREDAPENEIEWRHWQSWAWRFPRLLRSHGRIVGICAFGRCRMLR